MCKESDTTASRVIAIAGGAGKLGAAIARRLAIAGHRVVIGSRDADKARDVAARMAQENNCVVDGDSNAAAAARGDIVILAVPYASRRQLLEEIRDTVAGKIVVDTTVPLQPPKVMRVQLPAAGSAALETQALLGESVKVVAAFHNVAAHKLATDEEIDCDILVFGDDKSARSTVIDLVHACRLRGLHGGALANSAAAEALTSVLIFINKTYGVDGAGVRITGNLQAVGG
ncbi:MAG TPA: NADPH-dependent F420 reductase [Steroidobacter sp.]|uniref:NADPH-dependent F420 reductase n=1 Tax=Steroidobacter sp. TaxID=1978227 RepID=UPI002ED7BCB2